MIFLEINSKKIKVLKLEQVFHSDFNFDRRYKQCQTFFIGRIPNISLGNSLFQSTATKVLPKIVISQLYHIEYYRALFLLNLYIAGFPSSAGLIFRFLPLLATIFSVTRCASAIFILSIRFVRASNSA